VCERFRRQFFGQQLDQQRRFGHGLTIGKPSRSRDS
jgi:hypothetical protein